MPVLAILSSIFLSFVSNAALLYSIEQPQKESVERAYQISRGIWDSFGFSSIKTFRAKDFDSLSDLLEKVIVITKNSDASLWYSCQEDLEDRNSLKACVDYVVQTQGQLSTGDFGPDVFGPAWHYYEEQDLNKFIDLRERDFALHIRNVIDFSKNFISGPYYLFRAEGKSLGGDVFSYIIIDENLWNVMIIDGDLGC